jgi:BASS family bile acid:Na+ symporter
MTTALLLLIKISIYALIVAIGMSSTFSDVLYLWKRPRLLARSLFAMYVAVPLVTYVLVLVLTLSPAVKAALLVLAVSAGAPLLPRKLGTFQTKAYGISLVVISSLLAILTVPAWVALLAWHFGLTAELSSMQVAIVIAKAFLLPLIIGMVLCAAFPRLSQRLADRLLSIAGISLIAAGVVLLVLQWRVLLDLHWYGPLALLGFMLMALAIGHVCGGPDPDERTALAIACATRHVGIAVIVATTFPGPRTLTLLASYIIIVTAVSVPYLRWQRHQKPTELEGVR